MHLHPDVLLLALVGGMSFFHLFFHRLYRNAYYHFQVCTDRYLCVVCGHHRSIGSVHHDRNTDSADFFFADASLSDFDLTRDWPFFSRILVTDWDYVSACTCCPGSVNLTR